MIEKKWHDHLDAPFPPGWAGNEIEGIELAELDSTTAGCIDTFFTRKGKLDLWRTSVLGLCYGELCKVVPHLEGEARDYFYRLEELSRLVLESVRSGAYER